MEEPNIIRDLRVLREHFIPRRVVHRDGQLKTIRDNLKPVLKELPPRSMFLYGKPGTGKTCISRYVVEELKKHSSVLNSYINCWKDSSTFKVLYNILNDLGEVFSIHRKGMPTDELMETLEKKTKNDFCVVVLDELDRLEDKKFLYTLLEMENLGLVLISNRENIFYDVDPRLRSRLSSVENIEFPEYSKEEIKDILEDRTEWGLLPGVVETAQLRRIAAFASGDARTAIEVLRASAEKAENNGLERIPDDYVKETIFKTKPENRYMDRLNLHQKILLEIIKNHEELEPGTLYEKYGNKCREKKLEVKAKRTARKYLQEMESLGFINAKGEGRWRTYSPPKP